MAVVCGLVCYPIEPFVRRPSWVNDPPLPAKTISTQSIVEPLRCGMAITGQLRILHSVKEGEDRKSEESKDLLKSMVSSGAFCRGQERESCVLTEYLFASSGSEEGIGKAGWGQNLCDCTSCCFLSNKAKTQPGATSRFYVVFLQPNFNQFSLTLVVCFL